MDIRLQKTPLSVVQGALGNTIQALVLRSCDRYFNEYVPKNKSFRAQITGFDGSVGDAIIFRDRAHLFVDGRYGIQARMQAPSFQVHVLDVGRSIESSWLDFLQKTLPEGAVVSVDPDVFDLELFDRLLRLAEAKHWTINLDARSLLTKAAPLEENTLTAKVWPVDIALCGQSVHDKIAVISQELRARSVDGYLVTKLDDIAYLTNLRSDFFPHQRSVPGVALVKEGGIVLGLMDGLQVSALPKEVTVVKESEFFQYIGQHYAEGSLGVASSECSKSHERALNRADIRITSMDNPISVMKAIKNEKELLHMRSAFKKADHVVYQTQSFVVDSFEKDHALTEGHVDRFVKDAFEHSGAQELSFRTICASGKNGAIIHYGTPDYQNELAEGSLFLLDTGAYYEGGYATDLTRTFLAGKKTVKPKPWQQHMFTLVLKASIAGLSARFRRGTTGLKLDTMVRAPLWLHAQDFAHGTGHGVGINVHEFPPRIGPTSTSVLLENQVFSIEPGLYVEGLGGVRIENLVTVVTDVHPDFLRILPLTFCPFDDRLIERSMLTDFELRFLEYYHQQWLRDVDWPEPFCYETISFAAKHTSGINR